MSEQETPLYFTVKGVKIKFWHWKERLARNDNDKIMKQAEELARRLAINLLDCYSLLVYSNFDENKVTELAPYIEWETKVSIPPQLKKLQDRATSQPQPANSQNPKSSLLDSSLENKPNRKKSNKKTQKAGKEKNRPQKELNNTQSTESLPKQVE